MKLDLILSLLSTALLLACDVVVAKENNPDQDHHLPSPLLPAGAGGNTHIIPWNNGKHFQHLGQCDLVMMKDEIFAEGLGLAVHIRTKVESYWSFIKSVAIKIGNDVLEIEGSVDGEANYWINFDFQGDLDHFAGFPVTQEVHSAHERSYKIDLSSKYPGQTDITIVLFKEFVRVKFHGTEEAFGHTAGLLGNYATGKTYARNGATEIKDHFELGDQWQVLPYEPRLFRDAAFPQYPKKCVKPKDPRAEKQRMRGLSESRITYDQAEMACFEAMSDPRSIKDCVLDILATQDLDMVHAF